MGVQLLNDILAGRTRVAGLSRLAKQVGEAQAVQALFAFVSAYDRLPRPSEAQELFGMSYRGLQQWLRRRGHTLASIRKELRMGASKSRPASG